MRDNRVTVAQEWMNRLSGPKQKNLIALFKHEDIVLAMDELMVFPGYWDELQLGNWAKHLAANINELVIHCWTHLKNIATAIMYGHEDKHHLLSLGDIQVLQYRSPLQSQDRDFICTAIKNRVLLPDMPEPARSQIKENILSLKHSIPSIRTFHENMKYITIGAKILEKHIEMRAKFTATHLIRQSPRSLLQNLRRDWNGESLVEINHGQTKKLNCLSEPSALATMQLFIAALRYFPFLCSEAPLRDRDKTHWMPAAMDDRYVHLLCRIAKALGFDNKKIRQGCLGNLPEAAQFAGSDRMLKKRWAGGKPSRMVFENLYNTSFLSKLFPGIPDHMDEDLATLRGILISFFNVPSFAAPTQENSQDEEMSVPVPEGAQANVAVATQAATARATARRGGANQSKPKQPKPKQLNRAGVERRTLKPPRITFADGSRDHALVEPDLPDTRTSLLSQIKIDHAKGKKRNIKLRRQPGPTADTTVAEASVVLQAVETSQPSNGLGVIGPPEPHPESLSATTNLEDDLQIPETNPIISLMDEDSF